MGISVPVPPLCAWDAALSQPLLEFLGAHQLHMILAAGDIPQKLGRM